MNPRELENHLQDLFEGCIDAAALEALEHELRSNRSSWDVYRDYVHLHNLLQLRADGIDLMHVIPKDRVLERRRILTFRRAALYAAALLVISGFVAALVKISQPAPARLTAESAVGTRWAIDGTEQSAQGGLPAVGVGSTVSVQSGTVRLKSDSGAEMVLQGPASISFPQLEKPIVKSGWLWMDSGKSNMSFEVTTPDLLVRDIGTRFGVRVPELGPAELHLIDGRVDVFAKSSLEEIASLEPEEQGVAISATGELTGRALERDPFPDLDALLAGPASYPTTVRSQNPVGYWRLDDPEGATLANEIAPGRAGSRHATAKSGESGPTSTGGFHGFGEENRAIHLSGSRGKPPILLGSAPVHSGILFRDDFDGAGLLNGTRPDVAHNGAKWTAVNSPSYFNADGSFEGAGAPTAPNRGGSATLAFRPVDGVVYTLDVSLRGVKTNGAWIAMGFADGQSSRCGKVRRFASGEVSGRAWMLLRDGSKTRPNEALLGTSGTTGGTADASAWDGPLAHAAASDFDLRVVLDTGGGTGNWTATWWAKRKGDSDYAKVRAPATLLNDSISSVGLALSGGDITGTIEDFSLRATPVSSPQVMNAQKASAPANVARKEGAMSFWMRREPGGLQREMLWSAGKNPEDAFLHVHLVDDGRVGFFIENGRRDVFVTSEQSIADGRWHHIAASWNPSSVDLYVDGQLVANDTQARLNDPEVLPELRFGGGPQAFKAAPFSGWIDEIAQWDRALTVTEVQHQFSSAESVK